MFCGVPTSVLTMAAQENTVLFVCGDNIKFGVITPQDSEGHALRVRVLRFDKRIRMDVKYNLRNIKVCDEAPRVCASNECGSWEIKIRVHPK